MQKILLIFLILPALLSCSDSKEVYILKNKNFTEGDWILIKTHGNDNTFFVVDDEKILQNNSNKIKIISSESDHYTTCDGIFRLYKDGQVIEEQEYLDSSFLTESDEIKKAYRKAIDESISPINDKDFKIKWDSLKAISKCYPTVYLEQPENKNAIWFFTYK